MCSEPRNVSACSIADGNFDHLVMWLLPGFSTVGKKICLHSKTPIITRRRKVRKSPFGRPHWEFPGGSDGEECACNAGDLSLIPGSGGSPGEGNGNPFQYPCLENSMGRETWWATVHGISKSQT